MPRVAALDDYQRRAHAYADWDSLGSEVTVEFFHEPIPEARLAAVLGDFEVLVLMRERRWQLGLPTLLAGATLGLAGLGNLGSAMVGPARAFGMEVVAWSEHLTEDRAASVGVTRVSKEELLSSSDVLSIHLVLSDRTRGLIGAGELAQMRPGAVLVNTSRGPIVDERALISALREGPLAGAGLDVYDREPLPENHELTRLENVVLLPHLGYVSEPGFRNMYGQAVEDIAAFLGGVPIRTVG
jgi:phosphoglycerate dehydrogenase-like enzyme